MPSLGKKLQGGIKSLGKKAQSATSFIGNKIQNTEKQVQKGISKGIDAGQTVLRKTEKGIEAASGKLGAVKQGLMTGARVLDSLQTSGIATSVPGLSLGLGAVSTALKGGAKGFQKLQDVGADARLATGKAKNQLSTVGQNVSGKVSQVAAKATSKVEKVGERAKELERQAQEDLSNARSAFQG
jgi:BMFP domain-containing protein YqiC